MQYSLGRLSNLKFLPRTQTRSSTTSVSSAEYSKLLMKRFLFYVHPDFFQHFKLEQSVNAANLQILSNSDESSKKQDVNNGPRTLNFYIKPSDRDPKPRRVKVAMNRVIASIREILETLGVELPARPEGAARHQAYVSSNPTEVTEFLDTLIDRKDLMTWRYDRMQNFLRVRDILQHTLGVDDIDIR